RPRRGRIRSTLPRPRPRGAFARSCCMSEDVIESPAIVARMEHARNPADPLPISPPHTPVQRAGRAPMLHCNIGGDRLARATMPTHVPPPHPPHPPGRAPPPASISPSILRMSVLQRLAIAAALIALLWGAVIWAMKM